MSEGTAASAKVWRKLPPLARAALLRDLPWGELKTVLLDIVRSRASGVNAAALMKQWREDRYVRPSGSDPRELARLEAVLWELLPDDFEGVALSPTAPMGITMAVGGVNQNRVVSTTRGTEVVADSATVLALEAARRRRVGRPEVHLASCHRQLRAQNFGPELAPHFTVFALLSSAPDEGSGAAEAAMITRHLVYWEAVVAHFALAEPTIELAVWDEAVAGHVETEILPALTRPGQVRVSYERATGEQYRVGASLRIAAAGPDGPVRIGDGGLASWTGQLAQNRKERCFTSSLFTERLAEVSSG